MSSSAGLQGARLHPCFGVSPLPVERCDAAEAAAHTIDQVLVDGVVRLGESIMGELRLACDFNEPGPAQIAQVTRDGRLRKAENVDEVAHAELPGSQEAQDANASR